jgi:hypothetical protein
MEATAAFGATTAAPSLDGWMKTKVTGVAAKVSRVRAYWCWNVGQLLCVACWQRSGEPGQVQHGGDVAPGECCAQCGVGL